MSSLEDAREIALQFAEDRPPYDPYVYECEVRFSRLAWFTRELDILEFGKEGRPDWKACASEKLIASGYDGMADLYEGRRLPSFSALAGTSIKIISTHRVK